ncbi:FtsK/SpoIIIE domain-containing protein [Streptomyces sp. NPDC006339]|uniref:FtsK/SpoIIIE domain-containing protein n=1 Tax=Streptomyces sp. NPDC006339 TaxID=3156755 RepID=UPI0033BD63CE
MPVWMVLAGVLVLALFFGNRGTRAERRLLRRMSRVQMPMQAADAPDWMPGSWANGQKRHWLSLVPRWAIVLFVLLAAALAVGGWWLWVNYQGYVTAAGLLILVTSVWAWRRGREARRHREKVLKPFFAVLRKIFSDIPADATYKQWVQIPRHLMGNDKDVSKGWRDRLPESWVERYDSWGWVAKMALTRKKLLKRPRELREKFYDCKPVAWYLERQARLLEQSELSVKLPPEAELGEGEQARLTGLVKRRVPGEWEAHWDHQEFKVVFRQPPKPPAKVLMDDVREELEKLSASKALLGLGTRGESICIDFDAETPHVGLSIGTGGGKSSTLRSIIAQMVRKGAERVIIIDPKLISLDCFQDVPGIEIYTELAEQWEAVAEFRREMERRYQVKRFNKDVKFPRWILVCEEQNDFAEESYQYWSEVKDKKDPAKPPVFGDIARVLFKARQADMNVVSVYQRLTARAAGGTELRDQYGAKILARFSPQAWNSLVGTTPRPKSSRHNGRAIVVIGGSERQCQMLFMSDDEAREWALNGREPLAPPVYVPIAEREAEALPEPVSMVKGEVSTLSDHQGVVHGQSMDKTEGNGSIPAPAAATTESDVHGGAGNVIPLVKSAQEVKPIIGNAAAAEFLGYEGDKGVKAFIKARQRHKDKNDGEDIPGTFQVGKYPAWYPKDLKRWHAKLPQAGVKEIAKQAVGK